MNLDDATALDPVRPVLLHFLRSAMTPETDAIVDEEAETLGDLLGGLTEEEYRRLLFVGASIVSTASAAQMGVLNQLARALELPVRFVQPR
jgi:hypothetical protein